MRRPPLPDATAGVRRRTERVLADLFVSAAPDDPRDILRPPLEIDVGLSRRVRERMPSGLAAAAAAEAAFDLLWPEADIEPGRPALWHVMYSLRMRATAATRADINALHEELKIPFFPSAAEFDLFFSYTRADNALTVGANTPPWVTRLTRDLQTATRQIQPSLIRITGSDYGLYREEGLQAYRSKLSPLLSASRAAVIVLSPDFVRSEACQWELQQLHLANKPVVVIERGSLAPDTPIPGEIMAAEHSVTIPFYRPRRVDPTSGEEVLYPALLDYEMGDAYFKRVRDLVSAITAALTGDPGGTGPWVYLAETDDLVEECADLRSRLSARKLRIKPNVRYPRSSTQDYRDAALKDLRQCGVFAQMLGEHPGGLPGGDLPGICVLQYGMAAVEGKPMVRCVAEGVNVERSFQQWGDQDYRTLLSDDTDTVEYRSFVDGIVNAVEKLVAAQAAAAMPAVAAHVAAPTNPEAFLAFHASDSAIADQAEQLLRALGFTVTRRSEDMGAAGESEGFSVTQRDAVDRCDAMFLLFGPTPDSVEWVMRYAPQCLKYVNKRKKPLIRDACVLCSFGPLERLRPDLGLVENLRYEPFGPAFDRTQFKALARNVRTNIEDFAMDETGG